MRKIACAALPFLAGACVVGVDDIQKREPVRTMNFAGPHQDVAFCLQHRLGGKLQHASFGDALVIYDSVKYTQHVDGVSHYSVTLVPAGPDGVPPLTDAPAQKARPARAGGLSVMRATRRETAYLSVDHLMGPFWR
jgi:hypothetical protein